MVGTQRNRAILSDGSATTLGTPDQVSFMPAGSGSFVPSENVWSTDSAIASPVTDCKLGLAIAKPVGVLEAEQAESENEMRNANPVGFSCGLRTNAIDLA
jgi:hypothetical protein